MNFSTGITFLVFLLTKIFVVSCDTSKPTGMKQGIFCECCSATVKEISKKLEKKTSDPWEVKVVEAMEDICKAKSFRTYDYSPPTTVKACKFLLENYEEDIEQVFTHKESDPEKRVCYELSKACEGVDRTKKEKEDMDVRVNGEKQEAKDDGIQRLNVDINDPSSASRLAEQIKQQMAMQQAAGGSDYDDDEEDEEGVDEMPEEEEEDDSDEGNERSVKKPSDEKKSEKETEEQVKSENYKETEASSNQKTEL